MEFGEEIEEAIAACLQCEWNPRPMLRCQADKAEIGTWCTCQWVGVG